MGTTVTKVGRAFIILWCAAAFLVPAVSDAHSACTIEGTPRPDRLIGTRQRDLICARAGSDFIQAQAGDDVVLGGRGNDQIGSAGGSDRVFGGRGNDQISGEPGRNVIFGGPGADTISTGPQKSRAYGQSGRDFIYATGGDQLVAGGPGNDRCLSTRFGTSGDDLRGGKGLDRYAADASDSVQGAERFVLCYPQHVSVPLPGPEFRLFHGRTNEHFWNLLTVHRGRTWELSLVAVSGKVLFDAARRLDAHAPAVFGSYTWHDQSGAASIVFGVGRPPHAEGLRVKTTSAEQPRAVLTEDIHPKALPDDLRFFLQDFSGKILSIRPLDRSEIRATS